VRKVDASADQGDDTERRTHPQREWKNQEDSETEEESSADEDDDEDEASSR
jgi:hypothetical protein